MAKFLRALGNGRPPLIRQLITFDTKYFRHLTATPVDVTLAQDVREASPAESGMLDQENVVGQFLLSGET